MSFITLEDKKEIKFLDIGESFKGYKLIKILPQSAFFSNNNKEYEVRLSKEDEEKFKKAVQKNKKKEIMLDVVQKKTNVTKDEIKEYRKDLSKVW